MQSNLLRCDKCAPEKEDLKVNPRIRSPSKERDHLGQGDEDEVDHALPDDSEDKNKLESETYRLPMVLLNLFEKKEHWQKQNLVGKFDADGQYHYAKVHQNPMLYQNMYQYLIFRYHSKRRLSRVINKLYDWELEFHDLEHEEVLKCWRLHLGSCDVLRDTITALHHDSNATMNTWVDKCWLPFKTWVRNLRTPKPVNQDDSSKESKEVVTDDPNNVEQKTVLEKDEEKQDMLDKVDRSRPQPNCFQKCLRGLSWLYNTIFFGLRPFLGACAFYGDIFKNFAFVYLFWTALEVLTDDNFTRAPFEYTLIIVMILAIVLVQVSFMVLSMISSPKVFNVCHHVADECPKRAAMVRFVGFMLGPVAPIIIFGNYIFNREQEYAFKRELQTQGNLEYDLGNDEEEEMAQMEEEAKVDPDDDPTKVSLFRKILKFRYRAALSKRYYSYYRIIQATVESIVVLDVLTLILIVTSKPGRIGSDGELLEKNGRTFMAIVSEKLAEFLGFISSQGLIETLGISSTLAFYLALTYSLLMIITAIAR